MNWSTIVKSIELHDRHTFLELAVTLIGEILFLPNPEEV
jgi:hypothetical protein